jgi:hypothetical protein
MKNNCGIRMAFLFEGEETLLLKAEGKKRDNL